MFVARLRNAVFNTGQEKRPLYLMNDGKTTHEKGQARTFATDEEMDRFLRNLDNEGRVPEVEKDFLP